MTFRLGLTGSIGMGKSTTAQMFADAGCAVWDADAAVHRLYRKDGAAVSAIGAAFPTAVMDHAVDRSALREIIGKDPSALRRIEVIVHPLVREDRLEFANRAKSDILVFDIPLMFETGSDSEMDAVACVSVSPEIQESRVLERGTMTREEFLAIRDKQMPNAEKIARSDFVIDTTTLEHARAQVQDIIEEIKERVSNA
ncbi:dephospho-CoA kinase [Marivita sp. S2033]|uniref:dephospho-CoA kinase n=1 Tax=Marivita sp. S2033 TaxID=3373187 RepID=UPI00398272FD